MPLTGDELLQKTKELKGSQVQKAIACGYYRQGRHDQKIANVRDFLTAVLEAKGEDTIGFRDRPGRKPQYKLKVTAKGHLQISSYYLREIGIEPEDRVTIELAEDLIIVEKISEQS